MRSLDDWTKYLDQQEQALEKTQRNSDEQKQQPSAVKPRSATRLDPIVPMRPPAPKPTVNSQHPLAETSKVQNSAPAPGRLPDRPDPASDNALVQQAVRMRKRLPQHIALSEEKQEAAEKSYKGFKETREELLHRLLDPQLSLEDTARILNVCPTTVRRYTNRGLLKHIRTAGNQRRFHLSDVLAFLESQGGRPEEA